MNQEDKLKSRCGAEEAKRVSKSLTKCHFVIFSPVDGEKLFDENSICVSTRIYQLNGKMCEREIVGLHLALAEKQTKAKKTSTRLLYCLLVNCVENRWFFGLDCMQ